MSATAKRAFLLLIVFQALHSIEEYYYGLWTVLAPARFLSSLVSNDLPFGFAVVNSIIVALGIWTFAVPVRRDLGYARPLVWFWVALEFANGTGHLLFAISSRGYFPGAYTAPFLLMLSAWLAARLARQENRQGNRAT